MVVPCTRDPLRATASALLLAAAVLGGADALIATWHAVHLAPARTLPLCLTAPFPIALAVLAPLAVPCALVVSRADATLRSTTALLLGAAGGLAALHGLRAAWPCDAAGVASVLASGVVAVGGFGIARRLCGVALGRVSARGLGRLVALAALIHLVALTGLVWQWRREGRGLEHDLLARIVGTMTCSPSAGAAGDDVAPGGPLAAAPEHLVLITIDTLRADHLDADRMPRTAALAREGVLLTQAFASSSWTLPSIASLMTGLPAARHGAGAPLGVDPLSRAPLGATSATLATVLRDAGFTTRAVVTNPYLGLGYGLGRGFDAYENVSLESEAVLTLAPTVGFATLAALVPALAVVDRGDAVTSRAERFLRAAPGGRFFLWLHYLDPHAPYDGATRSFRDELLAGGGVTTRLPRMAELRAGEVRPRAAERAALRDAYARAVRFADEQVGRVADLLAETGLAGRTLLVVTADHGEELWEHGGVEHGHTLYDEVVRVPLVVRCPGCSPRAARIDTPVATAALAPTVLDLLGVEPNPGVASDEDDRALQRTNGFAALLRGEPWQATPVVSESLLFAEDRVALRTARHTYVAWPNGKEEIYDRARDPGELRDLAARGALVRRHRRLLAATRVLPAPPGADRGASGAAEDDARLRRALATLGYVQ